jgi:tRNA pseudouridine55 synthase
LSPLSSAPPPFAKIIRRQVDGLLLLDKPVGLSSTQAMAAAKRLFRAEKAGHTGTLDPFATGLLPIAFGEAAKFSRFMLDAEKSYRATLKLGEVSSTGDTEGEIIQRRDVAVTREQIEAVLTQFLGEQLQTPPMHSALKQAGVALYKLARQGITVPRMPRQITIFSLSLVSFAGDELVIDTNVTKGTYIRVLAENIGEALGVGAHLVGLRRTATGGLSLANAFTLDALAAMSEDARDQALLPAESLCAALKKITLTNEDAHIFSNGGWLPAPDDVNPTSEFAVYAENNRFLGVASINCDHAKHRLIPTRLIATARL